MVGDTSFREMPLSLPSGDFKYSCLGNDLYQIFELYKRKAGREISRPAHISKITYQLILDVETPCNHLS